MNDYSTQHNTTVLVVSGGSRHSAKGEGNLMCFPVSHVYFFAGGAPKFISTHTAI